MAEQDRPRGCGSGCPPRFHWPHQLCNWGCIVPRVPTAGEEPGFVLVQSRSGQPAGNTCPPHLSLVTLVTPNPASSDHFHLSRGTSGSYINCAPVNSTEKKCRTAFCPPSFVCALPFLLKSLSRVKFGETP